MASAISVSLFHIGCCTVYLTMFTGACSELQNGIQNSAVDINELQLVVPSRENENNNHSVSREQAGKHGAPAGVGQGTLQALAC